MPLPSIFSRAPKIAAFGDVRALIDLSDRLPTQTVRSEDQIEWQQFSTPVDIAAVMTLLANVQPDDIVLEPSAGNGLLVAQLRHVESLHLNELDPLRRGRLKAAFPQHRSPGTMVRPSIPPSQASIDQPSS